MNVKELKEALDMFPDEMLVCYKTYDGVRPEFAVPIDTIDRDKGTTDGHGVTEYVSLS